VVEILPWSRIDLSGYFEGAVIPPNDPTTAGWADAERSVGRVCHE